MSEIPGWDNTMNPILIAVLRLLSCDDIRITADEARLPVNTLLQLCDVFLTAGKAALAKAITVGETLPSEGSEASGQPAPAASPPEAVPILVANRLQELPQPWSLEGEEQAELATTRLEIAKEAAILRRHYQSSGNPFYVWAAIRLFDPWHLSDPFPKWVMSYLVAAAHRVVGIGEGIDWTTAPKPPPGRTEAELLEHGKQHATWSQSDSLDPKRVPDLVLKALGFSGSRGKSVYWEYRKAIEAQDWARTSDVERGQRERAKAHGVSRQKALGDPPDPSNYSKKIRKERRSLARGKLAVEPGSPVSVRLMTRKLRQT